MKKFLAPNTLKPNTLEKIAPCNMTHIDICYWDKFILDDIKLTQTFVCIHSTEHNQTRNLSWNSSLL